MTPTRLERIAMRAGLPMFSVTWKMLVWSRTAEVMIGLATLSLMVAFMLYKLGSIWWISTSFQSFALVTMAHVTHVLRDHMKYGRYFVSELHDR